MIVQRYCRPNEAKARAESRPTSIYALIDPFTLEVRYVGKTSAGLEKRLCGHCERWEKRASARTRVSKWAVSVLDKGGRPIIELLEVVPPYGDWVEAEQFWIAYWRAAGARLTNLTIGGEGVAGYVLSQEGIDKMRRSLTGKKQSEETKARRSAALRALPDEVKEKRRLAAVAAMSRPEYREKMAQITRARMSSPEERARRSEQQRQRMEDQSVRQNVSERTRDRMQEPEFRAKAIDALRRARPTQVFTDETREKIARAVRGEGNPNSPFVAEDIVAIRADSRTVREIAAHYGVSQPTIRNIKKRVSWSHIP